MPRKTSLDAAGVAALLTMSILLGLNNVVVKIVNEGLQPIFFAGLRSAGAAVVVLVWMLWRGTLTRMRRENMPSGVLLGLLFAVEFALLFVALDLTTVVRSSVIFYSMPLWLALGAHFLIPGERLTPRRTLGLAVAFAGVVWAMANRDDGGVAASEGMAALVGDLCALGAAICWAGIVLTARLGAVREEPPEVTLMWQLLVSAPLLVLVAPLYGGPMVREFAALHAAGFAFQAFLVTGAGFLVWFHMLGRYPSWAVSSFGFLTPVVAVLLGWLLLSEPLGGGLALAFVLVTVGIVLINWTGRIALPRRLRRP